MLHLDLTAEESDLIESIRNYRKVSPESRRNQEQYILGLLYDLMDGYFT